MIQNAIIKSVAIEDSDHGSLTAWLHLDYGGSGQGFGGFALYTPNSKINPDGAGHFIWRCMEIGGVSRWKDLEGKTIRVKLDKDNWTGSIIAIGHVVRDEWFFPKEEFEAMRKPA